MFSGFTDQSFFIFYNHKSGSCQQTESLPCRTVTFSHFHRPQWEEKDTWALTVWPVTPGGRQAHRQLTASIHSHTSFISSFNLIIRDRRRRALCVAAARGPRGVGDKASHPKTFSPMFLVLFKPARGWRRVGGGVSHEYEARPQRQMGARLAHPSLSILHTPRFSSATKVSLLVSLNLLFASPLNSTHPSLYPPALPPSPSRRLP